MSDGDRSISYSRTATDVTSEQFLQELLAQLGGKVVSQDGDGSGTRPRSNGTGPGSCW